MTIQISKAAQEQILQQIAKECREKAIKIGCCVAAIAFFLSFFVGGFPMSFFSFFGDCFFTAVMTAIVSVWSYMFIFSKEAAKHGIKTNITCQYNPRTYDDLFGSEHMRPSVNPATGLPMSGSVDAKGNAYGSKLMG